eukprot:TRINITY_DN13265_c0_g1_i2.p1 TRINITY_DN13265_c0_g1~~TRINITY_DN13265_c0_g1_i2.p1  ORF type:complete len:226 (-),score=33.12 TRINITY_DN13265_c0_g1_i2:774-1451(-)
MSSNPVSASGYPSPRASDLAKSVADGPRLVGHVPADVVPVVSSATSAPTPAMLRLTVRSITGEGYAVEVAGNLRGFGFTRMLQKDCPPGEHGFMKALLGDSEIDLSATLCEQGLQDGSEVTCVFYSPTEAEVEALCKKYCNDDIMTPDELLIFQSLTALTVDASLLPRHIGLPCGLQSLTFGHFFTESIENVVLPSGLTKLAFRGHFNRSMDNVACSWVTGSSRA